MKIKDILSLNYTVVKDYHGIDDDILYVLTDDLCCSYIRIDDMDHVEIRQYIKQRYFDDNRARYLYCIYYKEHPVFMYQYVGRGDYRNVTPLKSVMYDEFKQKLIEKYIKENKSEVSYFDMDSNLEIDTYGLEYEVRNNEIVCL